MMNLYIIIALVIALPMTIIAFMATGAESPGIALFMGLMIGMMWPALIIVWIVEYLKVSD